MLSDNEAWCKVELLEIISRIDAVSISPNAIITQLKHEEDGDYYQVWRIDTAATSYILKEAKGRETVIYQTLLGNFCDGVPKLYQVITAGENTYLLLEYIDGEDLCKCNRTKLCGALDALITLQEKTWEDSDFAHGETFFAESLVQRQNRGRYLCDEQLEEAYEAFLRVYQSVPRALCHDDLLGFNVIYSQQKSVLIDWEVGGILPYPTSFARLIAHAEENAEALFYMTQEDKVFAVDYYYDRLLKSKGISYQAWIDTLQYFLFYEYCEWVYVGNKYNATDGAYFQKYLPMAKAQAAQLLKKV